MTPKNDPEDRGKKSNRESFRFADETTAKIGQIRKRQGGLSKTRVLELAVDLLWDRLFDPQKKNRKLPDIDP